MAGLRTFDAFPKTDAQHVKKSSKGGFTSILTYLFLAFIAWSEFGSFFGGYIDQQYGVSNNLRETAQINMDIFVHMPCEWLTVLVQDRTGDRKLVQEELSLEDLPFYLPPGTVVDGRNEIRSPGLDEILAEAIPAKFREKLDFSGVADGQEFDGCHIFGSIPVNMVKGSLLITARGYSLGDFRRTPPDLINFSHVVNELSFGDFYPFIDNPLDQLGRLTNDPRTSYHYQTSVVPTTFKKLGAKVDTNQYSLSESEYTVTEFNMRIPGIMITYNFEALSITISDERISFWQFIVRLVAILSFIVYTISWTFRLTDKVLVLVLGPRWSLRYQSDGRQNTGILE
ncbi:LANO_0G13278g1_1 [Lachancea nothofagi CBS 11611]|uniref:Endoplasmic reticulum-Golgi intermediate compartment protein n=1 Tax=Lachancea nothofagi CBS 11611 TaxID=1266666 RepID=A0A1G4KKA5_9SACH|nr:LANO_0G13278g1_1 [Lachancea nothofagi CBS 11611]